MAITALPLYSGTPPNRNQPQADFNTNVAAWISYTTTFQPLFNTFATQANALAVEVGGYKDLALTYSNNAAASASAALTSQNIAASSANYIGLYSAQTGAKPAGVSVFHIGSYWRLNVAVSDITATEPSLTNADWQFISGTRWQPVMTTSGALPKNALCQILATSAPVDRQLFAAMAVGDFIVVANSAQSTQAVRITNNGYTIYGSDQSVSPSDNITLAAGEGISLRCSAANTLEVY